MNIDTITTQLAELGYKHVTVEGNVISIRARYSNNVRGEIKIQEADTAIVFDRTVADLWGVIEHKPHDDIQALMSDVARTFDPLW